MAMRLKNVDRETPMFLLPVVAMFVLVACQAGCVSHKPDGALARNTRLTKVAFSVVDVETTGLDPKTDRIVEIGVVKFRNGRKTGARSWLVNPGMPIPPSAVKIHGITTDMVRKSPDFAKVLPLFKAYIGDTVILAHNARYDISFFNAEIRRAGLEGPRNPVVDTLPVFRQWFPKASRHTMAFMVEYLQLETGIAHRGMSDALSLFEVFKAGVESRSSKLTLEDLINTAGGELSFAAQDVAEGERP